MDGGEDLETNVTSAYKQGENKFTGKINKVTLELKPTDPAAAEATKMAEQEGVHKKAEVAE